MLGCVEMNLYSYVVRYDSGFAPNPFCGWCTLATCKPLIRRGAEVGDWIVGSGSADSKNKQGGKLVFAMKVSEALSFNEYFNDPRFASKKPNISGSRKQARGDNIYQQKNGVWWQLDSYHANENGTPNCVHMMRDTGVDKVLISDHYVYFGCKGPKIPPTLQSRGKALCHNGVGHRKFASSQEDDSAMIGKFISWINSLGEQGYCGHPYDWDDVQL